MMNAKPQKEHEWLQQLVGEWTYESEARMGPGQPPMKATGSESVRTIGGLWIMAEGRSAMPDGTPATMMITLGYDPQKARFVGTWIGSMMTYLWHYDGELDAAGKVLTLSADGPSMSGDGTMAKYQDVIAIESPDRRVFAGRVLGQDGTWNEFMTAHYRRKK